MRKVASAGAQAFREQYLTPLPACTSHEDYLRFGWLKFWRNENGAALR
jgi:hypothetical protein